MDVRTIDENGVLVGKDRHYYAEMITTTYTNTVDNILAIGRTLIEAKQQIPHGEFIPMIEEDLPFGRSTADKLMSIARNRILSNAEHVPHLPASWGTLNELAKLPEPLLEEKIDTGEINADTTRADVNQFIREYNRRDQVDPPPLQGKYRVIYVDPPWQYSNSGFNQSAEQHYPTMSLEDICAMPVADIADTSCVLYMWATVPLLPEAISVMRAWGFEYKSHRIWKKDRAPGIGWWLKTKHELLLIGSRGNGTHPSEKLDSIVDAPVGKHSKKPQDFRQDIENVHDGPYIELFAREGHDGWATWGNEDD